MSDFNSVYTVKRELSQDQFMRKLLVELASNHDTPYDICTSTFRTVREREREAVLCDAHIETEYTASVGYDRKEEYWDKEKKYENGRTYYVDVKKTRTVTDWSPYSGHASGDAVCAAFNDAESDDALAEHDRISPVLKSIKQENIEEKGSASLSSAGLQKAKRACISFVEGNVTFPGDHVKEKRINSTARVESLSCFKMPFYEVDFDYNGKSYSASGFACGSPNATSELPPNNVDIKGTVNKETMPWRIGMIAGWVLAVVSVIASLVLGGMDIAWFWAIGAAMTVVAIVVTVIGNSKYNKLLKRLQSENKAKKLADLQAALAHYGFDKLTNEETSVFN